MQTRTQHLLDRPVAVACSGPLRSMAYPACFQTVNSSVRGMDSQASRSPETPSANEWHRPTHGIGQQTASANTRHRPKHGIGHSRHRPTARHRPKDRMTLRKKENLTPPSAMCTSNSTFLQYTSIACCVAGIIKGGTR
jgi:hypothetical protein